MVCVDVSDTAISVDVVAGKQQVAEAKGELTDGVTGSVPDLEFDIAECQPVALVDRLVQFYSRHVDRDALGTDFRIRRHPVAFGQQPGCIGVSAGLRTGQQFGRTPESLHVVDIGVSCDQVPTLGQRKIQASDDLDDLLNRILVADVDQSPFGTVVDQVDATSQSPSRLIVHLDHAGKQLDPFDHQSLFPSESVRPAGAGHSRGQLESMTTKRVGCGQTPPRAASDPWQRPLSGDVTDLGIYDGWPVV